MFVARIAKACVRERDDPPCLAPSCVWLVGQERQGARGIFALQSQSTRIREMGNANQIEAR